MQTKTPAKPVKFIIGFCCVSTLSSLFIGKILIITKLVRKRAKTVCPGNSSQLHPEKGMLYRKPSGFRQVSVKSLPKLTNECRKTYCLQYTSGNSGFIFAAQWPRDLLLHKDKFRYTKSSL